MNPTEVLHRTRCKNCGKPISISDVACWHTLTGCLSCDPVGDSEYFSEPLDLWTGRRAAA